MFATFRSEKEFPDEQHECSELGEGYCAARRPMGEK
jgi:hypothetical protein